MSEVVAGSRSRFRVEAPTAALAVIIYGGWIALTVGWRFIPWPLLVLAVRRRSSPIWDSSASAYYFSQSQFNGRAS